MKMTIEHTAEFFMTDNGYPVRAWQGHTEAGTKVIVFVSAIAVPDDGSLADKEALDRELVSIPGPATPLGELQEIT